MKNRVALIPRLGMPTRGEEHSQPLGDWCFLPDDAGSLEAAVDAAAGHALWHFNSGQRISASPRLRRPMAFSYVAIAQERRFHFALPH